MSKYVIDSSTLVSIGDAVREKDGTTAPIVVSDLASRIKAIPQEGGGGGGELPAEAYVIKGNCQYRFAYNGWNWFIDLFKDKITTKDISNCSNMFNATNNNSFTTIPFDINVSKKCLDYSAMFSGCSNLTTVPLVIPQEPIPPQESYSGDINISNIFLNCDNLREIPYEFFNNIINQEHYEVAKTATRGGRTGMFYGCYSLRELPNLNRISVSQTSAYSSIYYNSFRNCYALNEVNDIPVSLAAFTANAFQYTFEGCHRIKNFTFETNADGTPIVATWKNQTLDFSKLHTNATLFRITGYNSGITADKQVKDDATYQALKNDEDWFTTNYDYCRYNHDSAVNTINSLPDVSAGSGNTIKFYGAAGSLTDGGAINTLTEEEIAVASAKGWTVSFV